MADIPQATVQAYEAAQRLQAQALAAAWTAWDQVRPAALSLTWDTVAPALAVAVARVQYDAAVVGSSYSADTLAQQGRWVAPDAFTDPTAWVGYSSSGASLEAALAGPVVAVKQQVAAGAPVRQAMAYGRDYLEQLVRTQVTDTVRSAASVDIAVRPGTGYVRMLNPPSCERCVVLAGRFYRWNAGFRRHPRCDCVHVASTAGGTAGARAEGLIDDPYDYFNGLSEADQDRIFGAGNARAIRDGADVYRVVNSKRGRTGMLTTEGTSRRGFASDLRGRRLTPDGIYRTAGTRDEALSLLERHGYVLPGGQVPGGSIRGADYEGFGALGRGGTRVGAREAVLDARRTGVRNPGSRYTATEAERRVIDSRARYEAVLQGRNPWSADGKGLTPDLAARAENDYRRWLSTGGQIFTT